MADERAPRPDDRRTGDYRIARIASGTTLTAVLGALLLADAFSTDYAVDPLVLTILGTLIVTLFGLEAAAVWRGRQE